MPRIDIVARYALGLLIAACFTTTTLLADILVSTSANAGKAWDPLIGANPIFLLPSEAVAVGIEASNNPFNTPPFTGNVRLDVECCKDMFTKAPIPSPGLTMALVPFPCRSLDLTTDTRRPVPPLDLPRSPEPALPPCPNTSGVNVNVSPTSSGRAVLLIRTSANPALGGFIATLRAVSASVSATTEVFVNVLPSFPADGPAPTCPPALTLMSLASISPPTYTWKRSHIAATSYAVGVAFSGPASGAGLQFTVVSPGGTGPVPRNVAVVTFKNTTGRPVGMRTTNSRNCTAPGQQVTVAAGETKTLSFSTASTTTLVFAKSTCRAWVDWFDCWGGSALGLDDIVAFTEGPFWMLFGGRKVDIVTVGNWGALPRPNSIATIKTQ
jgi:hypothetical protein